jgi:hypothetical protein
MQVRIEKPNTFTKAIRIAIDLKTQQSARRTDNERTAHTLTWMTPTQISQWPVYIYNNAPQIINRENQNIKPKMDNRHRLQSDGSPIRREGKNRRSNIARWQYCNRLEHISSECQTLAFKNRDKKSDGNRLNKINNANQRFHDSSEAPPPYRNNDGRRSYPPNNTVHNN